jgi:hypothetical protein
MDGGLRSSPQISIGLDQINRMDIILAIIGDAIA